MKIIKLTAQNIKKLKAVEIMPDQKNSVVRITGRNGQGKTSVLDSILWALAGGRSIPEMPIRKGRKRGKIRMDLGELVVERSFTEKGSYLKVLTKDGAEFPKAQEKLSELMQGVSFDPAEFIRMDDKQRIEVIKEISGAGKEFDKIEADYKVAYEERKFLTRDLKEKKARLDGIGEVEKAERIDVVALSNQLSELADRKRTIDDLTADKKMMETNLATLEEQVRQLKVDIEGTAKDLAEAEKGFDISEATTKKKQLEEAREINDRAKRYEDYLQAKDEYEKANRASDTAQEAVSSILARKAELLQGAKMPIQEIAIEDSKVYVGGLPFDQLSTSEQIRISFSVAMAINPELKVIRITDGSLLDQDALKIIEGMATDKDYQVWIELVGDDGTGFCIEDGHIKGDETEYDEPETETEAEGKLESSADLEPESL